MLKLETKPLPTNVSGSARPELVSTHQLFVLVSSAEVDSAMLTRRVWEIVNAGGFHVRFIGLCKDVGNELATRRALVTMSSIMNYGSVISDVEVMISKNWVDNLKSRINPGDMVVYWDEQTASSFRSPLHQLLQANLDVPLYIVPGRDMPHEALSAWSSRVFPWLGFIAIMLAFLFLQIKIYQFASNWTTVLALLSTAVEFWLIWVWHNWSK